MTKPEVTIIKECFGDDPPIETFYVTIRNGIGEWTERYVRSELEPFLRGLEAGAAMCDGWTPIIPEIPR